MPNLEVVNFNIVCAFLGTFITLFGLVSYLVKEKFYLSEAFIATFVGLAFSEHGAGFIRPREYANFSAENVELITLYFARLTLCVQLVIAGVQLPSKYLKKEWRSLTWLLGPGMCAMWMCTSLLVWAMVPNINFLFALAVGSCVTPTDPVLSNSIVKGKFADKNIPGKLQKIIIAESGSNDGLGYPFLYLALYLIKYTGDHGLGVEGGAGKAMGLWFYEMWAYTILMSIAYGALVGWLAKELLHWAEKRRYVDRESFLVFALGIALFIVGTVGMLGSDDVLASFIAGNVFTWDDWFRLETEDDSLQPTIDMLLNVAIFAWFGAVCPWHKFLANDVIPLYRLVPLGVMVLLFRRLPIVLTFHKFKVIHQIDDIKHALFVGFFGPIGVSAIFYLYIAREFLKEIEVDFHERADALHLAEVIEVVVWFLIICSITVHGLSIPLGKLGFYLPRTISTAISSERVSAAPSTARPDLDEPEPFHLRETEQRIGTALHRRLSSKVKDDDDAPSKLSTIPGGLLRAGKRMIADVKRPHGKTVHGEDDGMRGKPGAKNEKSDSSDGPSDLASSEAHPEISRPRDARLMGHAIEHSPADGDVRWAEEGRSGTPRTQDGQAGDANGRQTTIQFAGGSS